MKRLLFFLCLLLSLSAMSQGINSVVPKRPSPPHLVNDFTGTLTGEQVQALERKLITYDDSTSNQIVVVIIKTTGDYPIEDVGLEVLRQWGVGSKEKNNGIVLLIAKDDHHVTIRTGYGLEGAIPDITAKTIIENDIIPNFKKGDYYRGLDEGTNSVIKAAAGEYKAPAGYADRGGSGRGSISIIKIIFIIIILIVIFGSMGGGNKGGGFMSRRGCRGFAAPFILGNLLGGGFGGGGGGGFGGGGDFGGGGFGGFGGGSGGGGGASGSW